MKKILTVCFAALLAAGFVSCSSKSGSEADETDAAALNTKGLKPTVNIFEEGTLAQFIEVADTAATYKRDLKIEQEEDGIDSTYVLTLTVKAKLVKESPELQAATAQTIKEALNSYDLTVYILDGDNKSLTMLALDMQKKIVLAKLLTGKVGDTAELTFSEECSPKHYEAKDFDNAVSYQPHKLDAEITLPAVTSDDTVMTPADTLLGF